MSPSNRLTNAKIERELGDEALVAARLLFDGGSYRHAVSRIYYAAFHYAMALLVSRGLQPKTHQGVIALISKHFVVPKLLAPEVQQVLSRLQTDRHQADYIGAYVVTRQAAEENLRDAEAFIATIKGLLPPDALAP